MVVTFVGFVGGYTKAVLGVDEVLLGGIAAACLVTWFTFCPRLSLFTPAGRLLKPPIIKWDLPRRWPPPRWALSSIWRDCPAQDEVGRQRASDPLAPNRTGDHQVVGLSRVARVSGLLSSSSWSRSAQPRSLPGLSNPAGSRDCFTATTSGRITPCLPSSPAARGGVNLDVVVAKYLHDGVKTFGRGIAHQLQTLAVRLPSISRRNSYGTSPPRRSAAPSVKFAADSAADQTPSADRSAYCPP